MLEIAIHRNDYQAVQRLLDLGIDVNQPLFGKTTALSLAVTLAREKISKLLLEAGANPNVTNLDGETPLYIAFFYKIKKLVLLLLKYGAEE